MSLLKYTVAAAFSLLALQAQADTAAASAHEPMTLALNQAQQVTGALAVTSNFSAIAAPINASQPPLASSALPDDNGSTLSGSEPGTYVLLAAALAAMGFVARRRQT